MGGVYEMCELISRQAAIDALDCINGTEEVLKSLPSAQFKRINKGTHEITESDKKISYAVICDKFTSPHIYFNTYDEAKRWARFNQPDYRPYYIVKRSEHFEIVGEVR